MAGKDGDRVVQGVKDGEIKAGSNQAVNGGQIHNISNSIKTVLVEIQLLIVMVQLRLKTLVERAKTILTMPLVP